MNHIDFKLLLFLSGFLMMSLASAGINAVNGFYIGGDLTYSVFQPVSGAAVNNSLIPIAGYVRPFVGYRFTDYLALEIGYDDLVNDSYAGGDNNGWGTLGPDHYRLYAIDLAGKFIYPFHSGFSIYAKGGAAYVHQDVYNKAFWLDLEPSANSKANRILPLVGAGISYNFTQHFSSSLEIAHLQDISPIGSIEMISLGISYTF